jgi:hypothetical protein
MAEAATADRLASGVEGTALCGILGRPFVDLTPLLEARGLLAGLDEVHEEVCLALAQAPVDYTGGSHRSMGIVPPGWEETALVDYVEVIERMGDAEFAQLRALADDPAAWDPARRSELTYGEERDLPLSRRQMLWLEARFGVYFPWKRYVELIPNRRWEEKADAAGKSWSPTARAYFPRTVALVKRLPFQSVGRCNVMGLSAHDHGTVHRDGDPGEPDPFITLCPMPAAPGGGPAKRLFLWDTRTRAKVPVSGRAVWFNDRDYHGVEADPRLRYSIRVDGPFLPEFLEAVRGHLGGLT